MNKTTIAIASLLAMIWLVPPAAAQSEDANISPDDYASGDFGRVRDADHGVTILRAESEQGRDAAEQAVVNTPVFPADVMRTDSGQRVEIQLARGAVVRLDRDSELIFLALPDPYAEITDHTVLQLAAGTVRLTASSRADDEFRVDTPSATVYVVGDADLRLEVERSGRTSVASYRGVAEVVGSAGSVILRSGMRTEVDPGALPRDPTPFHTLRADRFDAWVAEREEMYQVRTGSGVDAEVYESLPPPVRSYYGELEAHGSWVFTNEFGYVWYPGDVGSDWRPYHHGYWSYSPRGYFWVGSEPWGWAPYHYGRWGYVGARGWCWIPGAVFSGAWVSWSFGDAYVGWGPLDYWNRPAWHSSVYFGYYDPYAWTFVNYRHFGYRDCGQYGLPWHEVSGGLHRAAIVTRPPRVAPTRLAVSIEARTDAVRHLRGDAVRRPAAVDKARTPSRSFRNYDSDRSGSALARRDSGHVRDERVLNPRVPRAIAPAQGGAKLAPTPRYPRRLSGEAAAGPRSHRSPAVPESAPRQVAPRSTREPLRDVYRKMAQPRPTRPGVAPPSTTPAPRPSPPARDGGEASPTPTPRGPTKPAPIQRRAPPPRPPKQESKPAPEKKTATSQAHTAPVARPAEPAHRDGGGRSSAPSPKASAPSPTAKAPRPSGRSSAGAGKARPAPRKRNDR